MLIFAVQCKENGKKSLHKSTDMGGLKWVLEIIRKQNNRGLRTLVLLKD